MFYNYKKQEEHNKFYHKIKLEAIKHKGEIL